MTDSYFIPRDSYTPHEPEIFWCQSCDNHKVYSTKEDTGKFFTQFGHSYNQRTKSYDGEYIGIMFAICNHCIVKVKNLD